MAIADIDARDNARKLAASFDLTRLPPDFYADPYPYYRALRDHEPDLQRPSLAHARPARDRRRDQPAAYRRHGAGSHQAGRRIALVHERETGGRSDRRLRRGDSDRHHRQSAGRSTRRARAPARLAA